jgi:Fe-S cluster assembly protein SufD
MNVDRWRTAFDGVAPALAGARLPWLAGIRRRAFGRFAELGWPTSRLENWRHTSLEFLGAESFAAPPPGRSETVSPGLRALTAQLRGDGVGHWLVFVDGRCSPALSRLQALPADVQVGALADALEHAPEEVEAAFGDGERCDAPAALNAALAADGAFIRLPPGAVVEDPIHLLFVAATGAVASHLRNLVVAGAGAQATVVEHYVGGEADAAATMTNAVTRVFAGADARITHVKLQQESDTAVHLASIDAVQARGSLFASHSMSFGARLARHDIGTRFDGEGCETLLNGLYHVDGRRHVDHHTRIEHAQPRGLSREFYRGIVDGSARGVFNGRIRVAPGAVRTDAVQRVDSLLLSARAESDARPELEIYADDVKCAHGATVGQIDEESLFYLRTRGFDEPQARNMLTYAFAAEALMRIGVVPLRRRAAAAIGAKLPGGEMMEVLA